MKLSILPAENDMETHDKVFNSLLLHSYHMFRLFMGTMKSALQIADQPEKELDQLKLRATYFYSKVFRFVINYHAVLYNFYITSLSIYKCCL